MNNQEKEKFEKTDVYKTVRFLKHEIENFESIATRIKPSSGESPILRGIDIYGESIPLNGVAGGDHIIYVDFNNRYDLDLRIREAVEAGHTDLAEQLEMNKYRAGILVADAAGHNITDALLQAMLHQAFLTGVQYELKHHGQITAEMFEILNTRFFNSASLSKFITLIYGEIYEGGKFRFINAGHPLPVVFSSQYDKLIKVGGGRVIHFPPIGTLPSKDDIDSRINVSRLGYKRKYSVNEINLMGMGDILLLFTDGFSEHNCGLDCTYFDDKLAQTLARVKALSARQIFATIKQELMEFAPQEDDITFVVIKRV